MVKIETKVLICMSIVIMAMGALAVASLESVTVATFADPSFGSGEPMFTVDYGLGIFKGGWSSTGLTLEVPIAGAVYSDVTFRMDELSFPAGDPMGDYYTVDGPYSIRFFDGATEVVTIEFDRVWIKGRNSGLDAQDFYGDSVMISGIGIGTLSAEHFGFTFVNIDTIDDIFQATASFTSSAIPEPATIAILAFGGLMLRKCRK